MDDGQQGGGAVSYLSRCRRDFSCPEQVGTEIAHDVPAKLWWGVPIIMSFHMTIELADVQLN
jgi:hypothetical protein